MKEFEAGKLGEFPISIDAYFGPKIDPPEPDDDPKDADAYFRSLGLVEDPEPVEHCIYIGHGRATWDGLALMITMAPDVFRDAAASFLSNLETEYTEIEQRIFHLFTLIDPDGFSRFLSTLETLNIALHNDLTELARHPRTPTFAHVPLSQNEVISVFRRPDGVISHHQFYTELRVSSRTLKGWLKQADLVEVGQKSLTGWLFWSHELLDRFVPWLRANDTTYGVKIFIRHLIEAKLIQR